jgi:hypothetical protein
MDDLHNEVKNKRIGKAAGKRFALNLQGALPKSLAWLKTRTL